MAYGQFTGYEPAPGGGYLFQRANGDPLLFAGPEAETLKSRLDAYTSVNEPQVAGPGGGPLPAKPGGKNWKEMSAESVGSELAEQNQKALGLKPEEVTQAPSAGPQDVGLGIVRGPDGRLYKRAPGMAGVTQEQLETQAGKGTPLPRTVSETQQGGMEGSQEYLDARAEGVVNQRLALQEEMDRETAAADEYSQLAQKRFETQKRLMGEEQARVRDLEARVAREEGLRQKAHAEYTSSKVDPGRIFADPGRRIVAALAAAGGAYAATIAKTPNFAQQIIDQAVDRDIRAQEAAIRLKGEKANNLLSDLRKSGMDLEQARAAARGIQFQNERAQLDAMKARNAVPALQSHYEKLDMALQNGLIEANEAYRQATIGKTTRTTNSVIEYPRAGSAGGLVAVEDQLGTAKKLQDLESGDLANQTTRKKLAGGDEKVSPELRKVDQSLAGLASDQERLSEYGDDQRPLTEQNRSAPMRGLIRGTNDAFGEGSWQDWFYDDQDRNFIQDFEGAKGNLVAAISVANQQGAMQEGERKEAERKIASAGTVGELKRAQAWVRDRLEKQRKAAAANPGPNVEITK